MAPDIAEVRDPWQEALGARIKRARASRSLSQATVADWLGLTQSQVSKLERGTRDISFRDIAQLALHFGLPLQWFLDGRYVPRAGKLGLEPELQAYGIVDLQFAATKEPVGAFRTVEEVLCQALPGRPDPRLVEALPILVLLNPIRSPPLLGFARQLRVLRTTAFLCDVARHLYATAPWPSPSPLEFDEVEVTRFLDEAEETLARHPEPSPTSIADRNRLAKRWQVPVDIPLSSFEARCVALAHEARP